MERNKISISPTSRDQQRQQPNNWHFSYKQSIISLLKFVKLDKENNQCVREKTGAQNIVKEIKQCQQ
jgi:hypothetical protein